MRCFSTVLKTEDYLSVCCLHFMHSCSIQRKTKQAGFLFHSASISLVQRFQMEFKKKERIQTKIIFSRANDVFSSCFFLLFYLFYLRIVSSQFVHMECEKKTWHSFSLFLSSDEHFWVCIYAEIYSSWISFHVKF